MRVKFASATVQKRSLVNILDPLPCRTTPLHILSRFAIMARTTQRLQVAIVEALAAVADRHDVIDYHRRRDAPGLPTHAA
jgi:hypothetical protein